MTSHRQQRHGKTGTAVAAESYGFLSKIAEEQSCLAFTTIAAAASCAVNAAAASIANRLSSANNAASDPSRSPECRLSCNGKRARQRGLKGLLPRLDSSEPSWPQLSRSLVSEQTYGRFF